MELWDAYDKDFQKLAGKTLVRGELIPQGLYHLVCDIIVRHADGAYLLMQRDPRKPWGGMWEATAGGSALAGETPLECAARELREETGATPGEFRSLGELYPSPGYCGEIIHMYLARDLTFGESSLDEDEFLNVERIPFEELVEQVLQGEIRDAKTIAAVLKGKLLLNL